MTSIKNSLAAAVLLMFLVGCSNSTDSATAANNGNATPNSSAAPAQASSTNSAASATTTPPDPAAHTAADTTPADPKTMSNSSQTTNDNAGDPPKDGDEVAVIDTNYGQIVFKFFNDKAPKSVANFKKLATSKFYDGTKFHRVIPDFMIQGGDPNTKGSDRSTYGMGGPGWHVDAEFSDISHVRGTVSMARSNDPNSAGSQFFICVGHPTFLDGQYSAFGHVVKGMDVADKIVNLERDKRDDPVPGKEAIMKSVRIEKWPVK